MAISTEDPPSVAVVCEIADREGVDPTALQPPLWNVVDPEAMDRLVGGETGDCSIRFQYLDYEICVDGASGVTVDPVAVGVTDADTVS